MIATTRRRYWLAIVVVALVSFAPILFAIDAFKNFARVTVSLGYNAGATTIVLSSGQGALLPTPPFNCTWYNADDYPDPANDPNVEVIRVTGLSTDTATISRAQEGTSAATHNTSGKTYKLDCTLTAKTLTDIATEFTTARTVPFGGTGATTLTGILKGNGTAPVTAISLPADASKFLDGTGAFSTPAGGGGGSVTGGACTNQAVRAIDTNGVPTCVTITSSYVSNTIALTGVDVNTSNQVTATHLSAGLPVAQGGTALTSGTSGGVLGFTASGTLASSSALAANQLVLGGGAGATPTTLGSLGTTTTVYHGNAAGAGSFGTVSLTADVSGILPTANGGTGLAYFTAAGPTAARIFTFPDAAATVLTTNAAVTVPQGGTGAATLTNHGVLLGQATSAVAATAAGTAGQVLTSNGASADPTFQALGTTLTETSITTGTTIAVYGLNYAVNCASVCTVVLPTAVSQDGATIHFRIVSGSSLVTLDGNSTETIGGSLTRILWSNETLTVMASGGNWVKFSGQSIPMAVTANRSLTDQTSVTGGAWNAILLDSFVDGLAAMWDSGNSRVKILRPGRYLVNAFVYGTLVTSYAYIGVGVNGVSPVMYQATLSIPTANVAPGSFIRSIVAALNDYVQPYYFPSATSTVIAAAPTTLSVTEVITW